MEENDHKLSYGERVTSTYAEIYFDEDYCAYRKPSKEKSAESDANNEDIIPNGTNEWTSPSDLLIGKLDLKPPFTSKITRGKTHEGILSIGDEVLKRERDRFSRFINTLLSENDAAWSHILEYEKAAVANQVKELYQQIFLEKSKIMMEETDKYYLQTLQEIENHMRKEIQSVLISAHAKIVSDTDKQMKQKLKKEKIVLEKILNNRYENEIRKIKHYYRLLLHNENYRNNKLINQAICERNDALKSFYKQIDAENITGTMYVMSTERKKCRIKQFIMENYQSIDLAEKYRKIKERQDVLDAFKEREKHIAAINKEWEEKVKKILELFLKFLSFGLKLLPEQSSFLLDFEKMVVLQLNEIQKTPQKVSSILVDEETYVNFCKFEECAKEQVCEKQPFVIEGDLSDSIPTHYDSRETLPSDVDLPTIRIGRQFLYAKCHKYEEIKAFLDAESCKCTDKHPSPNSASTSDSSSIAIAPSISNAIESVSSIEPLFVDDIGRLLRCPYRYCKELIDKFAFPYLTSYLDFSEDNYKIVKAVLGIPARMDKSPQLLEPKKIAYRQLPFSATKETHHTVETQYSSQEDLFVPEIPCPCMDNIDVSGKPSLSRPINSAKEFDKIVMKRRISLERLLQKNPNLLKVFTEESFDFIYHIK